MPGPFIRPFDRLVGLVDNYRRHYDVTETEAHKMIRRDLREVLTLSGEKRDAARKRLDISSDTC